MTMHKAKIVEFAIRVFLPEGADLTKLAEDFEKDVIDNLYDYGALAHEICEAKVTSPMYELPGQPDEVSGADAVNAAEAHEALWYYLFSHPGFPPKEMWCCHGECQNIQEAYIVGGYAICTACGWVDIIEREQPSTEGAR